MITLKRYGYTKENLEELREIIGTADCPCHFCSVANDWSDDKICGNCDSYIVCADLKRVFYHLTELTKS